jgi:signal transduction histidine kinase/ActR/RegA family two-component response regulator
LCEESVSAPQNPFEERILVFALSRNEGEATVRILEQAGFETHMSLETVTLVEAIANGAAAVVIVEEVWANGLRTCLSEVLAAQAVWSDLPIIASSSQEDEAPDSEAASFANMTLLERPVAIQALVSATHRALRARRRQYQARAWLEDLAASELRLREVQERSPQLKDQFVATMSHELRTPLNAILGWARMLNDGGLDPITVKRGLESIERNALAQALLVEDLLDVSSIATGELHLDRTEVSFHDLLKTAIDAVRPSLAARDIELGLELDPNADKLTGDAMRLQQVARNLLSNAAKFSRSGGHIEVELKCVGDQLELSVSDDGQGFDSAFRPHLFQRFRQADGTHTRAHGGLGVGLSICRHLVELHGGTIEAHSDGIGKGAKFTVKLPRFEAQPLVEELATPPVSSPQHAPFEAPCELRGLKVLLVDDEPDARELLAMVLHRCGAITVEASSVAEAMNAMQKDGPPDIVVSDIGMPKEDGYELIRRIRMLPQSKGGRIPAAALTAFAHRNDRHRALNAGFEMHIAKPVEPNELVSSLATLARMTRSFQLGNRH